MLTTQKYVYEGNDKNGNDINYIEGSCLSADTKPTTGIANGSKLMEMDTSKIYMFDAENAEWREF